MIFWLMVMENSFARESNCLGKGFKLVGADAPAFVEAHRFVSLEVRFAPVARHSGVTRLVAFGLESDGSDHEGRIAGGSPAADESIGEHQFAIGDHFQILAGTGYFLA